MAEHITSRQFFQIDPRDSAQSRVVLCNQGFSLKDIILITEPVMESKLMYVFFVYIGYSEEFKLRFEFEKKIDCISAQRQLTRAWAGTGEYNIREDND